MRSLTGLDDPVIPHPAAVEKSGRDEKRRAKTLRRQDRRGDFEIVPISVVEGNRQCGLGQRVVAQPFDSFLEGEHRKISRKIGNDGFELCGGHVAGAKRIGDCQHSVEEQNIKAGTTVCERQRPAKYPA